MEENNEHKTKFYYIIVPSIIIIIYLRKNRGEGYEGFCSKEQKKEEL